MYHYHILDVFDRFPKQASAIGRLVVGYGELEAGMVFCVSDVLGDSDQAVRIMFRANGENTRIELCDAIVRPTYQSLGIIDVWGETQGALRHCKKIRNQYAHSHWLEIEGDLKFGDFERAVETRAGAVSTKFSPIDMDVLTMQLDFFTYTDYLLMYLPELRKWKAGESSNPEPEAPKRAPRPPLSNLRPTDRPE